MFRTQTFQYMRNYNGNFQFFKIKSKIPSIIVFFSCHVTDPSTLTLVFHITMTRASPLKFCPELGIRKILKKFD